MSLTTRDAGESALAWLEMLGRRFPGGFQGQVSPFAVLGAICAVYRISERELFGRSRAEPIATARLLAMTLVSRLHGLTVIETGFLFGCDHSSVSSARVRIQDLWDTDLEDRQQFEKVCKLLNVPYSVIFGPSPNPAKSSIVLSLANLDALDAALVRSVIAVLTDPSESETRERWRSGAIALGSDGTQPQWVGIPAQPISTMIRPPCGPTKNSHLVDHDKTRN